MIRTLQYPIVGAAYRPPADTLLSAMPANATLYLIPEPDNEHDRNAIAVWTDLDPLLKETKVQKALANVDWSDWINKKHVQLGYLPRNVAAMLKSQGFSGEHQATLYWTFGSNLPYAKFEFDGP